MSAALARRLLLLCLPSLGLAACGEEGRQALPAAQRDIYIRADGMVKALGIT